MVAVCAINMTIEQFRAEYHLLDRVSDGTVETYHAQAAAGVMVMVHFLRGTESRNAAILERIEHLETERRQKVLRIIDADGVTAVVTRFILELTTLEDWLGMDAAPAGPVPNGSVAGPGPERSTGAAASEPGEFTRLFAMPAQQLVNPRMPEPHFRGERPPAVPGAAGDPRVAKARSQHDVDGYRERLAAPSAGASPFPPPPATPPPPPPVVPTGPSEFTKVIESLPTPNLGPPPRPSPEPPPQPTAPPARTKPLVLALLGVLLASILFVVIVATLA